MTMNVAPHAASKRSPGAALLRVVEVAVVAAALLSAGAGALSLPGSARAPRTAQINRQRLDQELERAQSRLGVPAALLASILSQERLVRSAERGVAENDQLAASDYTLLYTETQQVEQTASATLRAQATGDLALIETALATAQDQRFPWVYDYQARMEALRTQLASAHSTRDYATVAAALGAQLGALRSLGPAYSAFQRFQAQLRALREAGAPWQAGETTASDDAAFFRDGATPEQYSALLTTIQAQMAQTAQLSALALAAQPAVRLAAMQPTVAALRAAGDAATATSLQRTLSVASVALAPPGQPTRRMRVAQDVIGQIEALQTPLVRLGAERDVQALAALLATSQRQRLLDPFTGVYYPAAYEYADKTVGYPHIVAELGAAKTMEQIRAADVDATEMSASLQALLADLHDKTPAAEPHAADLRLAQQLGLTSGKVIVVSLVEQVMRFYQDGKLVNWTYVTTGRPELPSPPGLHFAVNKASPVLFVSPEPRSSPLWFEPTPVSYAILYANGDDFIHDGWWRHQFGPGTQLPHYDPIAFNGGSHGCINLPLDKMKWVYAWIPVGAPVLVY